MKYQSTYERRIEVIAYTSDVKFGAITYITT